MHKPGILKRNKWSSFLSTNWPITLHCMTPVTMFVNSFIHSFIHSLIRTENTKKKTIKTVHKNSTQTQKASHTSLKYSQNRRFTRQEDSVESSLCEPRLYFSDKATTLTLQQPARVCRVKLSLRNIFNNNKK